MVEQVAGDGGGKRQTWTRMPCGHPRMVGGEMERFINENAGHGSSINSAASRLSDCQCVVITNAVSLALPWQNYPILACKSIVGYTPGN